MKILFFLLILIMTPICRSQFEFGPSNYFYIDSQGLSYVDTLFESNQENHSSWLPNYPEKHDDRYVGRNRKLKLLTNGNIIKLDEIGDSLIIYQEGANLSPYYRERDVENHGELRKSTYPLDLGMYQSDIPMSDEFGEPLTHVDSEGIAHYIYDTAYALVPHGLWLCKIDSISYEMGEYEMGSRIGEWSVYSSKYFTFRGHPVLASKTYVDGVMINESHYNDLEEFNYETELQLAVTGKWYNTGLGPSEWSYCLDGGSCTYVFSRDSSDKHRTGNFSLDYINLKDDGTFDKGVGRSCGTGPGYNESDRRKEWFVNADRNLNLDGRIYRLKFLSEKKMVLTFN